VLLEGEVEGDVGEGYPLVQLDEDGGGESPVAGARRAGGDASGVRAETEAARRRPGMDVCDGGQRREKRARRRLLSRRWRGLRRWWCGASVVAAAMSRGAAQRCVVVDLGIFRETRE
jgi:hypothetical protein